MKKKAMFVVAVAAVLVLAFSAVAMAKYAGAFDVGSTPAAGTNSTAGYLSWSGAKDIANDDNLGLQTALGETTTAHGGYTIATVKCAVCHSAHRAYASGETSTAPTAAGAPQGLGYVTSQYTTVDNHLTYGNACVNCHTVWGGGGATKKIEWAQTGSGPHNGQNCVSECHTGGIHGDKPSAYYGMNAFMLGDEKDTVITTALSKGNVSANLSYTAAGTQTGNAAWFQNGNEGGTPGSGAVPTGGARPTTASDQTYAAGKATATGYTCVYGVDGGCHTNSQFAVNSWGFAETHDTRSGDVTSTASLTGHGTGAWNHGGGAGCYPCHPGGPAGGYRLDTAITAYNWASYAPNGPSATDSVGNQSALAYGCDQCHDMVGRATNSTAFPHANRNIDVWEWDSSGVRSILPVSSGNIWMYRYDIGVDAYTTNGGVDYLAPTGGVGWSKEFRVMKDTVATYRGNITDGVCLKCHIPVDRKSLSLRGVPDGYYLQVSGRQHSNRYTSASTGRSGSGFAGTNYVNSSRIFLFK